MNKTDMIPEHLSEEYFDFRRTNFGQPQLFPTSIAVPVYRFRVWKGFENYTSDTYYERCTLVYEGVISSTRKVFEYSSLDRKAFKAQYVIEDAFREEQHLILFKFYIEGVSEELNAWVDWEIVGTSVRVVETD